jgi:hypothetical protein
VDNAMAQTNLAEISRQDLWHLVLDKEDRAVSPHIISKEKEVELPSLKKIKLDSNDLAPHIKRFYEDFKSMAPELKLVLEQKGEDAVFSKRVLKRGSNLSSGGYVLQYAFQDEGDGLWTVHAAVGASMRGDVYDCFFQIKKDMSVERQTCSCLNGYDKIVQLLHDLSSFCYKLPLTMYFSDFFFFFFSQNFCSHCVAGIEKLLDWNELGDEMTLVKPFFMTVYHYYFF